MLNEVLKICKKIISADIKTEEKCKTGLYF